MCLCYGQFLSLVALCALWLLTWRLLCVVVLALHGWNASWRRVEGKFTGLWASVCTNTNTDVLTGGL